MALTQLDVFRCRNIGQASIAPVARLNLVVGDNGSGKTSLLEAIYLLSRGRSFRTTQSGQVIQLGLADLVVTGEVSDRWGSTTRLGVRLARGGREIHINGQRALSSAELVRSFSAVVIQPGSVALLDGAPKLRRQFLDWGVFHVEQEYLDHWRRYVKALSHRNALLRAGSRTDLEAWNHELARYGTIIASARERYVARLQPHFDEVMEHFFPGSRFALHPISGWERERNLLDVLHEQLPQDLRQGYTQSGPHTGDFSVWQNARPAKPYLSRGQAKILVYSLLIAQARLQEGMGDRVTLLIDDLTSELDQSNRRILLDLLATQATQAFITATDPAAWENGITGMDAMFHVEQGTLQQV